MGFGRTNRDRRFGLLPALTRAIAKLLFIALFGVIVAGCSLAAITRPDQHTVRRGDTLYSIAQRYDLSWREIARWNNIRSPHTLSPGQILTLERYPSIPYPSRDGASQPAPASAKKAPAISTPAKSAPKAVKRIPPRKPLQIVVDKSKKWRWPTDGPVVRSYLETDPRHGVDIGGSLGDSIVAAESGRVVYSGAGLKGYGKLVIIKHDERFLTAYGFNRKVLVEQGDSVKGGQKIAEMGIGPRNESMLHFELRQDGEPVDPQRLLPRR